MDKPETKNSLKDLKFRNRQSVLTYMRNAEIVSVNDISSASGLSKMTVHKILDYYLGKGVVKLVGKGYSTEEGGKKPNLFSFNPNCWYIFIVRLEESYIATAVANLNGELIVERRVVPLTEATFSDFLRIVHQAFVGQLDSGKLSKDNCHAVVVACNGPVDYVNGVCLSLPDHVKWGLNVPMRKELQAILPGGLPIYVDNWFRFQTYGEIKASEPGKRERFFIVGNQADYLSGGMVIDGRVYRGNMGLSGEVGHMIVAPESENRCHCGGRGCLETEVAPSRLVAQANSSRTSHPESLLFSGGAEAELAFADITRAAGKGDKLACSLLDNAAKHFAVAINNIVQTCDPGTVVIHGDYAQAGDFFRTCLEKRVHHTTMQGVDRRTRVEYSMLGEEWSLIGAAHQIADVIFAEGMD